MKNLLSGITLACKRQRALQSSKIVKNRLKIDFFLNHRVGIHGLSCKSVNVSEDGAGI